MAEYEKHYYDDESASNNIEQFPEMPAYDETLSAPKRGSIDLPFLILTLVILTIGVICVLSASFASAYLEGNTPTYYFTRQFIFAFSGVGIMLLVTRFPVSLFRRWATRILIISIVLLVAVLFIGVKVNGTRRWIDLGITTFQPSELVKLAVILAFADMICKTGSKQMRSFRHGVLPFGIVAAIIAVLLLMEPHLSATIIIMGVALIMLIAGGTNMRWFVIMICAVAVVGFVFIKFTPYADARIGAWLDPESDKLGSGFQIIQSLYAIGSGGFTGVGLGQSRQKYLYLPEEHNDYIFAIACEELGFVGAMLILMLFALLIIRGFWIALHAKDKFSFLVATGISGLLALQVFLNVAVVTNLLPSTGISLPFFSYGGTALLLQLVEMGIILCISRDIPIEKEG